MLNPSMTLVLLYKPLEHFHIIIIVLSELRHFLKYATDHNCLASSLKFLDISTALVHFFSWFQRTFHATLAEDTQFKHDFHI